jgi:uroporphyrinogen III methyltransferase/synthase
LVAEKIGAEIMTNKPLLGKRVLVTRPAHQATELSDALRQLGAEPVLFPTIEIRPADIQPLNEAIQQIDQYDWLIITSANGVNVFFECLTKLGLTSQHLSSLQIAVVGPSTAATLEAYQLSPDLVPAIHTAEGLLEEFVRLDLAGQRILLPQADIARTKLADGLRQQGAVVDTIAAYSTMPLTTGPFPPDIDIVTFTSSSTVQGYVNCLAGRLPADVLANSRVVCIGPVTATTAEKLGVPVTDVADIHTIAGMMEIIVSARNV